MQTSQSRRDIERFEHEMNAMKAQVANVGMHLTIDSSTRAAYAREIATMADKLRREASSGRISWAQAADQAQVTRNALMEIMRHKSTPVGNAIAQKLKPAGYGLNDLIAQKVVTLYGSKARFSALSETQKNNVYASVVSSAGKSRPFITKLMATAAFAGRGLIVISLALSVYSVATAQDKAAATRKEASITVAGVAGGITGGAMAGLACGPGAPVCVTVGAFVGGALFAFGVSLAW